MCASSAAGRAVDAPAVYRICVQGRLDAAWQVWFDGMRFDASFPGLTVMVGELSDQAALHGLLARIRDLGLVLVSVERQD